MRRIRVESHSYATAATAATVVVDTVATQAREETLNK